MNDLCNISPKMPARKVSIFTFADRGCWALPQSKPDNFTCQFPTPTSAKGMLDGIFLDKITTEDGTKLPSFRYVVDSIVAVEHPDPKKRRLQGQFETIMLNGIKDKIPYKHGLHPFVPERRQRYITFMLYPAFKIEAYISLLPIWSQRSGAGEAEKNVATYAAIFERRVAKRQAYKELHFGLNMFPAQFKPYEGEKVLSDLNIDIGPVIYDYLYDEYTGRILARRYIQAFVKHGVMDLGWLFGGKQLIVEKEERRSVHAS